MEYNSGCTHCNMNVKTTQQTQLWMLLCEGIHLDHIKNKASWNNKTTDNKNNILCSIICCSFGCTFFSISFNIKIVQATVMNKIFLDCIGSICKCTMMVSIFFQKYYTNNYSTRVQFATFDLIYNHSNQSFTSN